MSYVLRSARYLAADCLRQVVQPGDTVIDATLGNGHDTCMLADLVGENGITKSSVDQVLKVEVTGAGCLQGYGSARPNIADDFVSDQHKTFLGKSLAVIRAGYETGCIHVKVSGEGLESVETDISVS